jgi:hypothetical protein
MKPTRKALNAPTLGGIPDTHRPKATECSEMGHPGWPQFCKAALGRTFAPGQGMQPGYWAQRASIESEARRLARSGEHSSWRSIERALLARDHFTRVSPYVFANAWTRSELDRLCLQARLYRKESA